MSIEITRLTSSFGVMTKIITRGPDGKPKSISAPPMSFGIAERLRLSDVTPCEAMSNLLNAGISAQQGLALGIIREGKPAICLLTLSRYMSEMIRENDPNAAGAIARTKEFFDFRNQESFAFIDTDLKQAPASVTDVFAYGMTVHDIICAVCPGFEGHGWISRGSTSAGIFDSETGEQFPGSGGFHTFLHIRNGLDIKPFTDWLFDKCVLAGLAWGYITRCGTILQRSIVDKAVASPERIAYEANPIVESPLAQDLRQRMATFHEGPAFDSEARRVLSADQCARLAELWRVEFARLQPEADRIRAAWITARAEDIHTRTGKSMERCREIAERWALPDVPLDFKNPELAGACVRDVWDNPDRFYQHPLADPIEGRDYSSGLTCAMVLRNKSGAPFINSFAHGGVKYALCREDDWHGNAAALGARRASCRRSLRQDHYPSRYRRYGRHLCRQGSRRTAQRTAATQRSKPMRSSSCAGGHGRDACREGYRSQPLARESIG
jgi:hypothetical protein